jgi:hypothetical protein
MVKRLAAVPLLVLLAGLIFEPIKPPPPMICGAANGPPVTSTRVKLNDGRRVAYVEYGVPKEKARNKIIFIHGFDSCRYDALKVSQVFLCPSFLFHYIISLMNNADYRSRIVFHVTSGKELNLILYMEETHLMGPSDLK